MVKFQIQLSYTTGDSFKSWREEETLEYEWENIEIVKENLKRIKEHYLWYKNHDKNWKKTLPDFCKKTPRAYSDSIYDYIILLESDNGLDHSVYPFWCGYFETLHHAKIIIKEDESNDLIIYMH